MKIRRNSGEKRDKSEHSAIPKEKVGLENLVVKDESARTIPRFYGPL